MLTFPTRELKKRRSAKLKFAIANGMTWLFLKTYTQPNPTHFFVFVKYNFTLFLNTLLKLSELVGSS